MSHKSMICLLRYSFMLAISFSEHYGPCVRQITNDKKKIEPFRLYRPSCCWDQSVTRRENYFNITPADDMEIMLAQRVHVVYHLLLFDVGQIFFNTLRPVQKGRHCADDISQCILFSENIWISIKIPLKFISKVPMHNIPSLIQIMAWRQSGDKPLSESIMIIFPMHIFVIRPQWIDGNIFSVS